MADNLGYTPGAGSTLATNDIAGIHYPRYKVTFGVAGAAGDVSATNPLPIYRPDTTATGTIAALSANVAIALNGQSGVAIQITGVWVGTLQFEGTVDGTTWVAVNGVFAGASAPGPTTTANGVVRVTPSGLAQFRITATAWTSGTATISLRASAATGGTFLNQSLPVGTNAIGTVSVGSNSLVSTVNSTVANLAAAAVFTGTSEDISEYSDISVSVFASHASATDGLSMQQSADGTNWDVTDVYSIAAATAGNGKIFHLGVSARFYRLVYTNGATLTTSLRIQTLYSKATKRGASVRPQDGRGNDNDFDEAMAFLSGYNGTTWDRLRSTIANGLAVDVTRLSPLVAGSAAIGTVAINAAIPTGANTIGAVTGPAAAALALNATLTDHTQRLQSTTLAVTVTAAANTAATATLPAVAAQFHYITGIEIIRTSTAALAGTATLVVTTSNLPGALAWSFGNAMAAGATQRDLLITFPNPIKSSVVNTATTVVMPAPGAAVLWRANIYYYTAA